MSPGADLLFVTRQRSLRAPPFQERGGRVRDDALHLCSHAVTTAAVTASLFFKEHRRSDPLLLLSNDKKKNKKARGTTPTALDLGEKWIFHIRCCGRPDAGRARPKNAGFWASGGPQHRIFNVCPVRDRLYFGHGAAKKSRPATKTTPDIDSAWTRKAPRPANIERAGGFFWRW